MSEPTGGAMESVAFSVPFRLNMPAFVEFRLNASDEIGQLPLIVGAEVGAAVQRVRAAYLYAHLRHDGDAVTLIDCAAHPAKQARQRRHRGDAVCGHREVHDLRPALPA